MTDVHRSDPLELRVLAALTSGPLSAADVALRTGEPEILVGQALERGVLEQSLTRISLAKAPAYSLTPKGLHLIALQHGVPSPAADRPADPVVEPPPDPPSVESVRAEPAPRKVQWRHIVYAALYVVIGLVVTMFSPVVGILAVLAGLGLGAWTLRPLFTGGSRS